MAGNTVHISPFVIKDCALIAIATGKRVQSLKELRNFLQTIDLNCIYYHFWSDLLRPRFDDKEFHNDFSQWIHRDLHDKILAEKVNLIDPTEFDTLEDLRLALLDVLEERLDELEIPLWASRDHRFEFIRSQIVIFNTHHTVEKPEEFVTAIANMSVGSIFYHFIDSRRRTPDAVDDFQNWIREYGEEYHDLSREIGLIDPYFSTLTELRKYLFNVFKNYFK
ncbi:MAG: hypothetical protein GY855_10170 [candidate division Zixibacteria bacterium]|nr:hypothetical protein [candidate division Zixibacteria bacterium]